MKTKTLILLALLPALMFVGCKKHILCEKGQGAFVTQTFDLPEIEGIDLCIAADVNLTYGETQEITVTAQQNVMDNLAKDISGNIWNIRFDECMRKYEGLTIDITLPSLRKVEVSGSGDVKTTNLFPEQGDLDLDISGSGNIDLEIEADRIVSKISGSGDLELDGIANSQEFRVSGSGSLRSYDMPTNDIEIRISGSGTARVLSEETLDVKISGSGDVYYKGSPAINVDISGSGDLHNAN